MADLDLDAIATRAYQSVTLSWEEWDTLVAEVGRLHVENAALRALVARFYTQAWEDPLTDDEMALLDPIVNAAVEASDG